MPWKPMILRGSRVLMRVDAQGQAVVEGGKVEIRYRAGVSKAYHAAPRNLMDAGEPSLPDDACAAEVENATEHLTPRTPEPRASSRTVSAPSARNSAEGVIVAYADGACSGNPGPAGLGVVLMDGGVRTEISEYLGNGTNNIAELTAILRVLERVTDPARAVDVHTDSQYSIGILSKGWKAKANQELIAQLRATLSSRPKVRFFYVPGHAGVPLNERADALAREAVARRASRVTTQRTDGAKG